VLESQEITGEIAEQVSEWLEENIHEDPTVVIDASLSVSGAAADAKATGDEIAELKADLSTKASLPHTNAAISSTIQNGKVIGSNGVVKDVKDANTNYTITDRLTVTPGEYYAVKGSTNYGNSLFAFYDTNSNPIYVETTINDGSTMKYYDGIILAPENAATLVVACFTLSDITAASVSHVVYRDVNLSPVPVMANTDDTATAGSIWTATDNGAIWSHSIPQIIDNNFTATYVAITGEKQNGKWINNTGTVSDITPTTWNVTTYSVEGGHSYMVSGCTYGRSYVCGFYDQNGAFISGLNGDNTSQINNIYDALIVAPVNAAILCVTAYDGNTNAKVKTINGYVSNAERPWKDKKWVVFGDSLTEENRRTTKHYFDYVKDATGINVYNMGNSGSGYKREDELGTAFYQRISSVPMDADVITIFGSFNDLGSGAALGTETDDTTGTIAGCMNKTLDNLFSASPLAIVGIVTPTPWIHANGLDAPNSATAYVDMLVNICKRRSIPCLNLFEESLLRPWEASFRELAYSKDNGNGVHPDETGHKMIAPRFRGFLETLLL